jgi:hypothetical protein
VTYKPATNYSGADNFAFKVNDGHVDSAPATVSISVNPAGQQPVLGRPAISADRLTLTATGGPGQTWTVERAAQPGTSWTNIGTLQFAADGTGQFAVTNLTVGAGYFRLKQP